MKKRKVMGLVAQLQLLWLLSLAFQQEAWAEQCMMRHLQNNPATQESVLIAAAKQRVHTSTGWITFWFQLLQKPFAEMTRQQVIFFIPPDIVPIARKPTQFLSTCQERVLGHHAWTLLVLAHFREAGTKDQFLSAVPQQYQEAHWNLNTAKEVGSIVHPLLSVLPPS